MKKFFSAIAALAFAGAAHAQVPRSPAPVWTGWYFGINGGGVWGQTSTGLSIANPGSFFFLGNVPAVIAAGSNSIDNSGALFGGQLGYLVQTWIVVAGIEAGFDWMNMKGSVTTTNIYPNNAPHTFTFSESVEAKWLLTLLGRVGFDFGAWYPYVTGGLAVANLKYTNSFQDPFFCTNCPITTEMSATKAGAAIGGGIEWRWDNHWSLRGEYLYIQLNGITGNSRQLAALLGGSTPTSFNHNATFYENIGRAALSYRF